MPTKPFQSLSRLQASIQKTIETVLEGLTDTEQKILLERLQGKEKVVEAGGEGNCDPFPIRIRVVNRYLVGMTSSEATPPDEIHVINPGGAGPIIYKLDEVEYVQAKAALARERGLIKERSDRFIRGRAKRLGKKRRARS